jgi:nucleoside-diphosphate-sugar epimerase
MKVLLTGANGFVGSHVAHELVRRGIACTALLRRGCNRDFLTPILASLDVREGALGDSASLDAPLEGVTHVIHCAGATKALNTAGYFEANQAGTRNLVDAINRRSGQIRHLLCISSLAAIGPALEGRPVLEDDPAHPVSDYGRSKLAGEEEVRSRCKTAFTILRPPAVYGPRDAEFLRLFRAVKAHVLPRFNGGRQALNLVFVEDLAAAIVACLDHPRAMGRAYFVAHPETVTAGQLAETIARTMQAWTLPLPLPNFALRLVCAMQEEISRRTGRPCVLNRQKYAELVAPAWTCSPARLRDETGIACPTGIGAGAARTLAWYRGQRWI